MTLQPSFFSRGHLGETAAALVDGELCDDDRDRALVHLAGCAECRADVETQRRAKSALRRLSGPAPSVDLTARLLLMGSPPTRPVPPRPAAVRSRPPAGSRRPVRRGGLRGPAGRRARSARLRYSLAGAASVMVLGVGAALLGGSADGGGQRVVPAVDRFAQEHAATTSSVPLGEPAVGAAVSVSFAGAGATGP